ncbi:MAG: FAD binding domain-containing protein [Chloroflexota bacterium]
MIPRFSLTRPGSIEEALDAFDRAADDVAYLAGGTELLQVMKMGLAQFTTLIDLKGIAELKGISVLPVGTLRIGATSTHRDIERSPLVRERAAGLARLESRIANVRVRNAGTLGGNLAFAEPHSDPATFLLACGASLTLAGRAGRRELEVAEFAVGPLATAREQDEVLVEILIPAARPGEGRAYDKIAFFERPAASVAVRLTVVDGSIADATVAVGSLTDTPVVVTGAGGALQGAPVLGDGFAVALDAAAMALGGVEAMADLNGSADYKRHLAGVLLGRAAGVAVREATAHA